MTIPKTASTELLRVRIYRALSMAALAAWEGDMEAAEKHCQMARLLAAEPQSPPKEGRSNK